MTLFLKGGGDVSEGTGVLAEGHMIRHPGKGERYLWSADLVKFAY